MFSFSLDMGYFHLNSSEGLSSLFKRLDEMIHYCFVFLNVWWILWEWVGPGKYWERYGSLQFFHNTFSHRKSFIRCSTFLYGMGCQNKEWPFVFLVGMEDKIEWRSLQNMQYRTMNALRQAEIHSHSISQSFNETLISFEINLFQDIRSFQTFSLLLIYFP